MQRFQLVKKGWINEDGTVTEGLYSENGVKYELGGIITAEQMAELGDEPLMLEKQLKAYRDDDYSFVVELEKVEDSKITVKENGSDVSYSSYKVGSELFDAFSYVVKK